MLDRQHEIRETLERELTSGTEQLQAANQRAQELEWRAVTLQTRVDALEQAQQQAAALEEEFSDANARLLRTREQLAAMEKERAQLKNELKTATKQVDELWAVRKERDGLRSDHKSLSTKVEELERNQREMFEARGQLQAEVQDVQVTLEETCAERNQLQTSLRAAEDDVRELVQVQESLSDKNRHTAGREEEPPGTGHTHRARKRPPDRTAAVLRMRGHDVAESEPHGGGRAGRREKGLRRSARRADRDQVARPAPHTRYLAAHRIHAARPGDRGRGMGLFPRPKRDAETVAAADDAFEAHEPARELPGLAPRPPAQLATTADELGRRIARHSDRAGRLTTEKRTERGIQPVWPGFSPVSFQP